MANRDIIVVGASAGGVVALTEFVSQLPEDLPASVFVVLHIPPSSPSRLPEILTRAGPLKAIHPGPSEKIRRGLIYVAPPDHHLLLEDSSVLVKNGPKENRSRPSIDALFRSAAYTYGSRVIGIVLSGVLDDGTSGLWTIKRRGGVSIIQDPEEARFADMPLNVMRQVEVDYAVPASKMGSLLGRLVTEPAKTEWEMSAEELNRLETEIAVTGGEIPLKKGLIKLGELTQFTCPECEGALIKLYEGRMPRFRCHTGHGFTASSLLDGITEKNEELLWQALRGLNEAEMLLDHIGRHFAGANDLETAAVFFRKSKEAADRAKIIKYSIMQEERLSEDVRHEK